MGSEELNSLLIVPEVVGQVETKREKAMLYHERPQTTVAVVGILPAGKVIYGQQVVVEDEDKGCIIWNQGMGEYPAEYFPIMEEDVYNEIVNPLKVAAAA